MKTPYINDWIADENISDTKSEDEPLLCDGLNIMIDGDEDSSRGCSVHNHLFCKLMSYIKTYYFN
jgi:hypothetical protein